MEVQFFIVKLTNIQRIKIHEQRLKENTIKSLALNFEIQKSNIKYLVRLLNKILMLFLESLKIYTIPKNLKIALEQCRDKQDIKDSE